MTDANATTTDNELGSSIAAAFTEQALHNVNTYARLGAEGYTAIETFHSISRQTMAGALLRAGGHFHRLALLQDITDRYCEAIGRTAADIPFYQYFQSTGDGMSPLDEAKRCYETAAALDDKSPEVRFCLATIQRAQHEDDAAIDNFDKAAHLKPAFEADSFWNIACIHQQNGRNEAALEYFRKAAKHRDSFGGMHVRLSRFLRRSGAIEESLEHFEKTMTFGHTWLPEYHLAATSADDIKLIVAGVDGYDLYRARGKLHAVPSALGGISHDDLSPRTLQVDGWRRWVDALLLAMPPLFKLLQPIVRRVAPGTARRVLRHDIRSGPTIESIGMSFVASGRNFTAHPAPIEPVVPLNESHAGYNLFRCGNMYFAVPKSMGSLNQGDISTRHLRRGGWRDRVDDFFFARPFALKLFRPLLSATLPGVVRRIEQRHIRAARSLPSLKAELDRSTG